MRHWVVRPTRPLVMNEAHARELGGHFSIDIIVTKMLNYSLWWETMHKDVNIVPLEPFMKCGLDYVRHFKK